MTLLHSPMVLQALPARQTPKPMLTTFQAVLCEGGMCCCR
jgi:hypothetical protein